MSRVFLALGSNLGDRDRYLSRAREALAHAGVQIVKASPVLETEPVGKVDQPRFLNQVLEAETTLRPRLLLNLIKDLERQVGRVPGERWGPREIDIDILRYAGEHVDEPGLHIPHPELENRPFLQQLLAEVGAP